MIRVDNDFLDAFARIGAKPGQEYGDPVAKKLGMLIRPTFIAPAGRTLVWGDWSAIEARVLPWLAGSDSANALLDVFRVNDADPTRPDIYVATAAMLMERDPEEIWAAYRAGEKWAEEARQAQGKVPVLSLGFGGGLGALQAMATNYGVYFSEETGKATVARWREANPWARDFWGTHSRNSSSGLWGAANSAIENPETTFDAGRVTYVYDRRYLGGTLFCLLPDGRPLTYPSIKWEWREVKDKKTGAVEDKYQLTFRKGYRRSALWYGKLAENNTQAWAATVLRRTLRRLRDEAEYAFMPVVMHTHDEVVTETDEADAGMAADELKALMERPGPHDPDLPLKAEVKSNWYYTKAV